MCGLLYDTSQKGLRKVLREYKELALRFIWEKGEDGAGSGKTWSVVNERLGEGKAISRTSIIFFLNRMVDKGVLVWRKTTGKGGRRKIYYPKLDERGYKKNT